MEEPAVLAGPGVDRLAELPPERLRRAEPAQVRDRVDRLVGVLEGLGLSPVSTLTGVTLLAVLCLVFLRVTRRRRSPAD